MNELSFKNEQIADVIKKCETSPLQRQAELVASLIKKVKNEWQEDETAVSEAREAVLALVRKQPNLLKEEPIFNYVANEINPDDLEKIEWDSPAEIIAFCEYLYSYPFEDKKVADNMRHHVFKLMRQALHTYEQDEKWEKLFQLMRIAPTSPTMQNLELRRLRHRAYSYELKRVQKLRRLLYIYLIIQTMLVIFVFPLLFINAENGALQRQVEKLADVELGDEGYRTYSYADGLYWATITAGSIGYGDITPATNTGKIIAGVLGTMGVITVGVVAGLILDWITPRQID